MKRLTIALLALVAFVAGPGAWAVSEQAQTVQDATDVLNDFVEIPENAIPSALLAQAYGIAIIPSVFKAGFVFGGQHGEGVLSVRTADGSWSHPVFIDLTGASVGWQIGASSTDVILVFKSQRGVDKIVNGEITLGGDASVAAGPVGRSASASTNLRLNAEIYSYSRSRGLFAGIALKGGVISIDNEDNWRYYGEMLDPSNILHKGDTDSLPKTAKRLLYTLNQYMPPVNGSSGPVPYGDTTGHANQSRHGQSVRQGDDSDERSDSDADQGRHGKIEIREYDPNHTSADDSQGQSRSSQSSAAAANRGDNTSKGNYGPVYDSADD